MNHSNWKQMRKTNSHQLTRKMEQLAKKTVLKQIMIQKVKNDMKMKRSIEIGVRRYTNHPNWYVAESAKDVMKYIMKYGVY